MRLCFKRSNAKLQFYSIINVVGDVEYRSEESMPMMADILRRELNAEISICYTLDSSGYVDPNRTIRDRIALSDTISDIFRNNSQHLGNKLTS